MKKIIFFSFSVVLLFLFIIYLFLLSVPNNPIFLDRKNDKNYLNMLFPQGWAFFTKNPHQPNIFVYSINNEAIELCNFKNVQAKNYFGLNKSNRYTHMKIGELMNEIPKSHWYSSPNKIDLLEMDSINSYRIKSSSSEVNLAKGKYLIQLRTPIRWVWFSRMKDVNQLKLDSYYILLIIDDKN